MDMQHHEPECHAEKLAGCLQCQGHSKGLYNQTRTISTISSKALVLGLIVQHHKPECPVNFFYIQGQSHSKGSKCQWMFVRMISSEPQNILLPNLVWWCSIMSQSVMWGKIVYFLQGQGHSEALMIKVTLGLMICHHKPVSCEKKKKKRLLHSRSRLQWRFKTLLNLYVSYIFCTADLLAAKLLVLFYY